MLNVSHLTFYLVYLSIIGKVLFGVEAGTFHAPDHRILPYIYEDIRKYEHRIIPNMYGGYNNKEQRSVPNRYNSYYKAKPRNVPYINGDKQLGHTAYSNNQKPRHRIVPYIYDDHHVTKHRNVPNKHSDYQKPDLQIVSNIYLYYYPISLVFLPTFSVSQPSQPTVYDEPQSMIHNLVILVLMMFVATDVLTNENSLLRTFLFQDTQNPVPMLSNTLPPGTVTPTQPLLAMSSNSVTPSTTVQPQISLGKQWPD